MTRLARCPPIHVKDKVETNGVSIGGHRASLVTGEAEKFVNNDNCGPWHNSPAESGRKSLRTRILAYFVGILSYFVRFRRFLIFQIIFNERCTCKF